MVCWGESKGKIAEKEIYEVGEVTFPTKAGKFPTNDPVVIKVIISNLEIKKSTWTVEAPAR
jgi:hypothetical protein